MLPFLRKAGLEPPTIKDDVNSFKVIIRNHGLLDSAAVEWLSTFDNRRPSVIDSASAWCFCVGIDP